MSDLEKQLRVLQKKLARSEKERAANEAILEASQRLYKQLHAEMEAAKKTIEEAHDELQKTQNQLVQAEKMASLGQLTAGMAHELNNPAAASQRGAEHLRGEINTLIESQRQLGEMRLNPEQSEAVQQLISETENRAKRPVETDALALSVLEERLEDWLQERGFEEPWDVAHALATIGLDEVQLDELSKGFENDQLPIIVASLSSTYLTRTLVDEIHEGSRRISEIVKALKSYSYLDQAPIQNINVHEGLDSTLVMLQSRLKAGVEVTRSYADDLPQIDGYGGELNQVWTNILDNAIDAMDGEGAIEISTRRDGDHVVVEVTDNGRGFRPRLPSISSTRSSRRRLPVRAPPWVSTSCTTSSPKNMKVTYR